MMEDNIPNYPGYHITRDGKVFCRKVKGSTKGAMGSWYEMKYRINQGYKHVNLWKNSNRKVFKVHRLVAIVYLSNPDNKPLVCHKNNIKTDNRVENLYWGTYYDNNRQAIQDGIANRASGKRCHFYYKVGELGCSSIISNKNRLKILELKKQGLPQHKIADMFGLSQGGVSRILKKMRDKEYVKRLKIKSREDIR